MDQKNMVAVTKDISDTVLAKVKDMEVNGTLALPDGYNAGTALRSAMLILQDAKDKNNRSVLETCTKATITNSLLNMVVQGLQPVKKQCYFIAYGDKLELFRSYFGTQCALKRAIPSVYKIVTDFVYYGETVTYDVTPFGERYVKFVNGDPMDHEGKEIKFGYCNIFDKEGNLLANTMMYWTDIQTAWRQSRNFKADGGVHQKFPLEMAKRTLITRACKNILNSSTENANEVVINSFNQTTDAEFKSEAKPAEEPKRQRSFKERFFSKGVEEPDPSVDPVMDDDLAPEPELGDEFFPDMEVTEDAVY